MPALISRRHHTERGAPRFRAVAYGFLQWTVRMVGRASSAMLCMTLADGQHNARSVSRWQADPVVLTTVGEDLFRLLRQQLDDLDDAAGPYNCKKESRHWFQTHRAVIGSMRYAYLQKTTCKNALPSTWPLEHCARAVRRRTLN